jgi:ABC-type cobalamin/Fe3+-siderophores transport system ATPase subunit
MGPNGSGKSTALKIAAGLLAPTVGSCLVLGKTATRPLARALIGYMLESPSFPDHLTGEEVVRYYAELSGLKSLTARMAARQALAQAGLQGAESRPAEAHAWLCQVHRALPANNPAAQSGRVLRKIRDLEAQLQLPAVQTYKPTAGESDTTDTGIVDLPDGL